MVATRTRTFFLAALAALALVAAVPASASAQDSKGDDFWLMFPGNLGGGELKLFIAGDTATTGNVAIPGLQFSQAFNVTPGSVTTVDLPSNAQQQSSDTVESLGIHVTAGDEVTVYGLNRVTFTTDAYLGLPVDALGTDYINLGYQGFASQFGVVASQNATTVTITPTVETAGHPAGTPYTVNLNQGQTYQLRAAPDLSGSIITSNKPIAVFGGHQCANIPPQHTACDHIVEQLTATSQWGRDFLSMPLATRSNGDTFRVLASENDTIVQVNGSTVATLDRGQLHEQIIEGPARITADKPVLVMQYSNGQSFDNDGNTNGDPFQMLIPPAEQYLPNYTVSTPAEGFDPNFVNVIAPNSAVGSVRIDGAAIPAGDFTPIGSSGFSGAQVEVGLGSHTVTSPQPIGVHSYGFGDFDSYGYPGGLSLSEIALVSSISLTPETSTSVAGTEGCLDARVTDQDGTPLQDIRVDFTVSGANTASGFAFTGADGVARFCYTGANLGNDQIEAAVGTLVDTATKTWRAADTSSPDTPITSGPPAFGPGNTATFTFTSSHTGATFECSLDGGPFVACTSPFTTPNLPPGRHTLAVRSISVDGVVDPTPTVYVWTIARELSDLSRPVLGEEINVGPVPGSGPVYFAVPPSGSIARAIAGITQKGLRFRPLKQARQIPVGSFLKTRQGTVELVSATGSNTPGDRTQSGKFSGGVFQVLQERSRRARGLTELRLKGSSFDRCQTGSGDAGAAQVRRRSIRRVRSNTSGRFSARGRYSAGTTRGTVWITADRCDGTLTKVRRGKVAVRDFRRKKTVIVSAGKSYLAKAPR
jgi:hypothetical protein